MPACGGIRSRRRSGRDVSSFDHGKSLGVVVTPIPGLVLFDLPVHGDNRGWFKENWQREKMRRRSGCPTSARCRTTSRSTTRSARPAASTPSRGTSTSRSRPAGSSAPGSTCATGRRFGAVFTAEIDPSRAVFVPRGVGNAYQTLEADTAYTYLVNDHWSPDAEYTFLNLADETAAIEWPIPLTTVEISAKDLPTRASPTSRRWRRAAPSCSAPTASSAARCARRCPTPSSPTAPTSTSPTPPRSTPGTGATTTPSSTPPRTRRSTRPRRREGRRDAWAVNVTAVAALARVATANGITLVHVSSDYVFDGTARRCTREDEPVSPLGVYGQTKAAGDAIVATVPRHYIVRTSWVIGDGRQLRAHHARRSPSAASTRPSSTTRSGG